MRQRGRKVKAREFSANNVRVGRRYFHRPRRVVSKFPQKLGQPTQAIQENRSLYIRRTNTKPPRSLQPDHQYEPPVRYFKTDPITGHVESQLFAVTKATAISGLIALGLVISSGLASMIYT